jgi:hypothetical protein
MPYFVPFDAGGAAAIDEPPRGFDLESALDHACVSASGA